MKRIKILGVLLLFPLTQGALSSSAQAAAPTTITYQGRILNNTGTPVTTTKFITLTLKDLNSGSSDIVFAQNVTPSSQGEFSVSFSIPGSFKWDTAIARLEVKVDSDVLTPTDQFGLTPYSIVAASVTAGGVTTNALANGAVTDVKVSTISASKIILPGGSTPISTWQLGAGNFIDAAKVALPGSTATVASWQYGSTGFIDVAKVTGTIPTTPAAHSTSHGLVGSDPLTNLSPQQISGTAVVSRSTSSQTIQPQVGSDVVPLVLKPNNSVPAGALDVLQVFTNASTTSVTVRGDGLLTARAGLTVGGALNATNSASISGTLQVSTISPTGPLNVAGALNVTGGTNLQAVTGTNANLSTLTTGGLNVTGTATATVVNAGNLSVSGTLSGGVLAASYPILVVQEEQPAGTEGGTFTAGAWRVRTLNTVSTNTIPGATLSANTVSLPPGTYQIFWRAPAYRVDHHQTLWRNTTDSTNVLLGSSVYADNTYNVLNDSVGFGVFSISTTNSFQLWHRCLTGFGTNGLGTRGAFGEKSIFASVFITKIK